MAAPELVIVPAHPGPSGACPVEFEVRVQADGRTVLPVFSSMTALVRAFSRYQPWVCVQLRMAREFAARAGLAQVVIDPEVTTSSPRWGDFTSKCAARTGPLMSDGFQVTVTDLLQAAGYFRRESETFQAITPGQGPISVDGSRADFNGTLSQVLEAIGGLDHRAARGHDSGGRL